MGAIHYHPEPADLAQAVAQHSIALVRRADPYVTRASDGISVYRHEVIEWLKGSGPSLLELRSPREFSERQLQQNPYSHPVEMVVTLEGGIQFGHGGDDLDEFIIFVNPDPDFAFGLKGLRLPPSRKAEILALAPPPPPPPKPGFWARLFRRKSQV